MRRRTLLIGSVAGLGTITLSSCFAPTPAPGPAPVPVPTTTPIDSAVPQPASMLRSSWTADPHSRGAFSFDAVNTSTEDRNELARPIGDRLFFAGEATAVDHPGTVSGARDSGLRVSIQARAGALSDDRFIVVGAGIAGLTAARDLSDAGFSVVVVEARDRLGGRVSTVRDDDWGVPIELGSSFVSSAEEVLLAELRATGADPAPFDRVDEIRTSGGDVVAFSSAGEKALHVAQKSARSRVHDVPLSFAIASSDAGDLSTQPGDDGVAPADWLEYQLRTRVEPSTGASPDRVSSWSERTTGSGDLVADRRVLGGYDSYVDDLAQDLEILLSSIVSQIAYDDTGVRLRLARGESLSAARVIITVPLGVLKANTIDFVPAVPLPKARAVSVIGSGSVETVWLRYDDAFWSTDATVWTSVATDSPFAHWVNLMPATGAPILVGTFAADQVPSLTELEDEDFLAVVRTALEPFAGG